MLAPLRRRALEVSLLLAEPGSDAPDPRAIGLALLDVLQMLAEQDPVVLALDDLQWLDPSSAGVLQIALRRLRDERVGVLATVRTAPETTVPVELDRAFAADRLARLPIGPLSMGALHHLLRERVGLDLTRPELVRVQEASAGNPFFALELGRELVRTGSRPTSGKALPVPESLHELLGGRLARLPTDTGDVVLFAAALARPTVELVVKAHGHRETVVEALDTAAREGVVELDDSRLRFAHPLLASICYEQAPIWKRRAIHGALARAVADVEERARHMALSVDGPDAVAASYLDAAAEQAGARGATAAAAELSELAADLTPDDPALERQRRLRAAKSHRLAGDGARAVLLLDRILTEVPEGLERSDVLFELASTLKADPQTTIERLDEALANAAGDEIRQARILGYRGWIRVFQAEIDAALVDTRAALEKAERMGDPELIAVMIGHVAIAEGRAGDFTPGLVERGVEIEQRLGLQLQYNESPSMSLSRRLAGQGELDRARALLEEIENEGRSPRGRTPARAGSRRPCPDRVVRGKLAAGARPRQRGARAPRPDPARGRVHSSPQSPRRGGPRPRRAGACVGRTGSDDGRGDVRQGVGDPERGRSGAARVRARRSRRGSGLRARAARRAPLEGIQGSDGSRLGRRDRDPHRRRRARPGEGLSHAVRGELAPCGKPVGGRRRRALPWPPRSRRGRPGCRSHGIRAISYRARGASVSVRARPHAALPRHGASTGPAEEGRPRGAWRRRSPSSRSSAPASGRRRPVPSWRASAAGARPRTS